MRTITCVIALSLAAIVQLTCQVNTDISAPLHVNTSHLDHLYQEIPFGHGDTIGIVHIYAEYPGYEWVGDEDEGIACIDDAARAAIFYFRHYRYTNAESSYEKARRLMKFVLAMQAPNGFFYNFIWPDHTIHKEGPTTKAEPGWWSWRAMWAIAEALSHMSPGKDDELRAALEASYDRLMSATLDWHKSNQEDLRDGEIESLLPAGSATDQAALIILGSLHAYQESGDEEIRQLIESMAQGIIDKQIRNKNHEWPDGAFLSWENIWHAYGNSQSYALLKAAASLEQPEYRDAAMREIENFYPALLENGLLHSFIIATDGGSTQVQEARTFEQIAYGIRPIVWACLEAYRQSGDAEHFELALDYTDWFTGANAAGAAMYDAQTGRGYDGIIDERKINRNSGAESTIEALLSILEMHRQIDKQD